MTPLKIKLSDIPEEIVDEYNLREKATPDGWFYIMVVRGMYGLPQAGSFGHDLLEECLNKEGYFLKPDCTWILEAQNQEHQVCACGR